MTFVRNHAEAILACDFFVSVTASFRMLYAFVIMEVGTRRIAHVNITAHPTAGWVLQQFREDIVALLAAGSETPVLHFLQHSRSGDQGLWSTQSAQAADWRGSRPSTNWNGKNHRVSRLACVSDAVKEENRSDTKIGVSATANQSWMGGSATATASQLRVADRFAGDARHPDT
jgi:hypothetical protein